MRKTLFELYDILVLICFISITNTKNHQQTIKDILPKFDVLLVGTNDIHGSAFPTLLSRKDTGERYTYGGLVYMANIIQNLKNQYDGNLLYLDAGDQFQGGFESSKTISSGEIISDYLNHQKTNGNAVGNHQFDFGPQFLDAYLSKLTSDITSANLIDNSTNDSPLRNQKKSNLYKFQIKDRNPFIDPSLTEIKIGVIGLSTLQTPKTTSGFTQKLFPDSYQFLDYKPIIQRQSQRLKSLGAHAIIMVGHVGNGCDKRSQYGLWTMRNQPGQIPCQMDDEVFKLIDNLDQGTIDAVVQGHRHTQSHYFYKGIPIIGTINGGFYINTLRLRFTLSGSNAYLNDQDLLIEGPIPICERIFQHTRKCQYVTPDQLSRAGQLIEWSFHGKKVSADAQLDAIYKQKYAQKMKQYEFEIASNFIPYPITKDYLADSALGNLVTNIMGNAIKRRYQDNIDFVVINAGGLRTTWYPGVIRYAQQFSMFPFDNQVVSFKILGSHLKLMLQILQNGQKRYYPTWGLQQIFARNSSKIRPIKFIKNKHLLTKQQLRLQQMSLSLKRLVSTLDKSQIQDEKVYKGVTLNFCLDGGDDFSNVVNKPDKIRIYDKSKYQMSLRDLIQFQLEYMKEISEKDLIGPNQMTRIIIQDQINETIIFN